MATQECATRSPPPTISLDEGDIVQGMSLETVVGNETKSQIETLGVATEYENDMKHDTLKLDKIYLQLSGMTIVCQAES